MVNKAALVASYIFIITVGGVTNKLAYQISTTGKPQYPAHEFKKPWFMVLLMFIGMTLSFPVYWLTRPQNEASNGPTGGASWKVYALIFIPAMFDLLGSILAFTGLKYIGNSTALMLGSMIILFVGVNSYIFLGRRYNSIQLVGMLIVLVAIVIIGKAASLGAEGEEAVESSAAEQGFGMLLCILARFVNSLQFVVEEKLLGETSLDPLQVVGTEGVYGLLVTACIIMPVLANIPGGDVGGVYEDTVDSLLMLTHNGTLDGVLFLYLLGLWGLNALGMMVMKHLGGVFRAVSTNLQSLFVWLIDLGLFYGLGNALGFPVGEAWKGEASWLQVGGFVVLVAGTLTYAYGNSVQSSRRRASTELPPKLPSLSEAFLSDMSPGGRTRVMSRARAGSIDAGAFAISLDGDEDVTDM